MKILKAIFLALLEAFGALWLIVEILSYFGKDSLSASIKSYWWLFLLLGVVSAAVKLWPKRRFSFQLDNRDIQIELVVGDIFKQKGGIIVGSNTSFETSLEIISKKSIQGLFCTKFFPNNLAAVSAQINNQIQSKPTQYGATAIVRASKCIGYFCAIAEVNSAGVAKGTFENLRISLGELWSFLSHNAEKDMLNVPILGSGFSRITENREVIAKEIIRSFIAATAGGTFCDGLRVVIHPSDVKKWNIDILDLAQFIEYSCKFSIVEATGSGAGTPEA